MAGWITYEPSDEDPAVQIVPERDLCDHDLIGFDCLCGPSVDFSEGLPIVTHHSLDGREASEARS